MATYRTYKKQKNGIPDVYIYDMMPTALKNQIYHIWADFLYQESIPYYLRDDYFKKVIKDIEKEAGLRELPGPPGFGNYDPLEHVFYYFSELEDIDEALTVVQITFDWGRALEATTLENTPNVKLKPDIVAAIAELNERFKENGVGYEYSNGNIIRLDNDLLHSEAIRETIRLISEPEYKEVNDEFMQALNHYREGRPEDCLNWCGKAFESSMKIILKQNGWAYGEKDTAQPLLAALFRNNFLPQYFEQALTGVRGFLSTGISSIRNRNPAAHSSVEHPNTSSALTKPQDSLIRYMIYITGSTIRFFIELQKERE